MTTGQGLAAIIASSFSSNVIGWEGPIADTFTGALIFDGSIQNLAPDAAAPLAIGATPTFTPGVAGTSLPYLTIQGGTTSSLNTMIGQTPQMTVMVLVRLPATTAQGQCVSILGNQATAGMPSSRFFYLGNWPGGNNPSQLLAYGASDTGVNNYATSSSSGGYTPGAWQVVCATIDTSGSVLGIELYNMTNGMTAGLGLVNDIATPDTDTGPVLTSGNNQAIVEATQWMPFQMSALFTTSTVMSAASRATMYAYLQKYAASYGVTV